MTTYTFHIEWRDGQTMTGTLVTDDPQRFIRAVEGRGNRYGGCGAEVTPEITRAEGVACIDCYHGD